MGMFKKIVDMVTNKVESDIFKLKMKVARNNYIMCGTSDEVVLFRSVLRKDMLSNDDVNDLLICFSDHIMDDNELLSFVLNNKHVFYEMEEAVVNIDIRNLIIKYLLQSDNKEILLGILRMYGTELIGINSDDKSLYDIYLLIEDIVNEVDLNDKKEKIILFMMNYSVRSFLDIFKSFELDYSDIEYYILEQEANGTRFLPSNIALLLENKLIIEERKLGSSYLVNRVLTEYKKYSGSNITFNLNEFVNYYNRTFNDDFRAFYYNKTISKLDVELLISILSRNDEYEDSLMIYGEYLDKFKSLSDINYTWQEQLASYFNAKVAKDNDIKTVLVVYSNAIERLKSETDITLDYYVYLNVPEKYREAFNKVIRWYYDKDKKYFGRNIFASTKEQQDTTFNLIVSTYKDSVFNDFGNRKAIHKEYFAFIRKMTNARYISVREWNEYLYSVTREYYAREGLIHIGALSELLSRGESLLAYQIENFSLSDFNYMIAALKYTNPDMEDTIIRVKRALNNEVYDDVMTNRVYIDEMVLESHSSIIRDFINSDCPSRSSFLKKYDLSGTRFDRALVVVSDKNPELYEQYRNKVIRLINGSTCFIGNQLKKIKELEDN